MKQLSVPLGILVSVLLVLSGCQTSSGKPILLTPSMAPGTLGVVNPSLSAPSRGFHGSLGFATSKYFQNGDSAAMTSTGWGATTSVLLQSNLAEEESLGWFGSLSGSLFFTSSEIETWQEGTEDYTEPVKLLVGRERSDLVGDVSARFGLAFRRSVLMASVYGLGGFNGEEGEYSDFRRNYDGQYHLYNMSRNQTTPYVGAGFDANLGSADTLIVGGTLEFTFLSSTTQSYASSTKTNTNPDPSGTPFWVYTVQTASGGKQIWNRDVLLQVYGEVQGFRAYLFLRDGDLGAGVLYHF